MDLERTKQKLKKITVIEHERNVYREFPGDLVVRTWHFHCSGLGSVPGWGTEIAQATPHCQKEKEREREKEKCIEWNYG